jgi:hypothetical protein
MKNFKAQLRKYKLGYELFGKSITNFINKNTENPIEKLGSLSSLKNELISKEILYGSAIEQLLSADWLFHAKCVLKGSLSFKFDDFGKENFEHLQKFKTSSLKKNGVIFLIFFFFHFKNRKLKRKYFPIHLNMLKC